MNFLDEINMLRRRMDRLMESMWGMEQGRLLEHSPKPEVSGEWARPLADMRENDADIVLTLDLPGVEKEDIKVNVADSVEIRAEKKTTKREGVCT